MVSNLLCQPFTLCNQTAFLYLPLCQQILSFCVFYTFCSVLILNCFAAGILVSVKTREQQKLHKLKDSYDHLVQRVTELQELTDKLVSPKQRPRRSMKLNERDRVCFTPVMGEMFISSPLVWWLFP